MALSLTRQLAWRASAVPAAGEMSRWAETALTASGNDAAGREMTVRVVGEAESRELNRRWRGRDAPTNVLAFPGTAGPVPAGAPPPPLGDLVICAPVVVAEARAQGKPEVAHWCHLVVHGTLHLAGFDHADEDEAARMEGLETRVLAALGFPDPYRGR